MTTLGMSMAKDLAGEKFGRLTVLSREANSKSKKAQWRCRCDCGTEKIVRADSLTTGNAKSCGCLHVEMAQKLGKSRKQPPNKCGADGCKEKVSAYGFCAKHSEPTKNRIAEWRRANPEKMISAQKKHRGKKRLNAEYDFFLASLESAQVES